MPCEGFCCKRSLIDRCLYPSARRNISSAALKTKLERLGKTPLSCFTAKRVSLGMFRVIRHAGVS